MSYHIYIRRLNQSDLEQLAEIRKSSFAKLICKNSQFAHQIQPKVFLLPNELTNAPIHCEEMQETNLRRWVDQGFLAVLK